MLFNGLHQDIFENFIASAKRTPYDSYSKLKKALERTAAEPRMLTKLAALKPGRAHATLVTQAQQHTPDESAL